jgi:hypothetical protein
MGKIKALFIKRIIKSKKTTIAGLVVAVIAFGKSLGIDIPEGVEAPLTEIAMAIVAIVLIIMQEE